MKAMILELRTPGKFEQIRLYDSIYTHYTEEDGVVGSRTVEYGKAGLTREQCLRAYQEIGFEEVTQ